jgi:hypothetical protein
MTAARQQRKPPLLFRLLLGIALGVGISTPTRLWAATDNQLAVNASDAGRPSLPIRAASSTPPSANGLILLGQ